MTLKSLIPCRLVAIYLLFLTFFTIIRILVSPVLAHANHTSDPGTVTIAGSLQSELGCPGDWQPECPNTKLLYDGTDDVWQGVFSVPAGNWEYKATLNDSWDENYGAGAVQDGPNIQLNLGAETVIKFYYDHKSHWITDNMNSRIVTSPGNFQSALGCPGDWQPDCLRSWLQNDHGVYTFQTTAIPAGSYEGKFAINESWDENYGAGGVPDGPNIPFIVVNDDDTVTFTFDSTTNLGQIVSETNDVSPEIAALVTAPARNPIQDEIFYFVMPDRFANGRTDNDTGGIPGDRLDNGFDPADKSFFHGGDLAGLTNKLDYLAEMGITAIWMTPIFKNIPVQDTGSSISAGYHGYWFVDMTQSDPHFGTNSELETLIDEAHVRGIKVFFDIITNHTADILTYDEGTFAYRNKFDYPYRAADGTPFDDRDYAGGDTFPPLDPAVSFPYTPKFNDPADASLKVPAWLNNPIYYHNRGNSSFTGENSLYGDFFGLDDLFTEHPDVVDGMVQIYKDWITGYNIDGFRIDTVKHTNLEFWQEFLPQILTHAESEGRTEFFLFGEVFSGNPMLLSNYTSRADFPAVQDFRFQEQVRSYASAGDNSDIMRDLFADDDYFTDADSNVYALPTFISSHDRGRFGWFLDVDNGPLPDAEKIARSKLATAMMFFARGVPVIYYGDEQGFIGDGGDHDARQDMFPSQVASYNDDDLMGTSATTADNNFDGTHPLYQSYSNFAELLSAHPALRNGAQLHRYSQGSAGIYAFSRIGRDELVEYIVAFNNANSSQAATFATDSPDTTFTEIYPGTGLPSSSDADGFITVAVPAFSFTVYMADAPLPASENAPDISFNTLVDNQEIELQTQELDGNHVQDRIEVGVSLSENKYAEVTFAVRKTGETAYTVIGVDDNSPYRVFFSLGDVPSGFNKGDMLDFVAVVKDNNGNLNYVEVAGIKPVEVIPPEPGSTAHYAIIHYFRDDDDYGDHTTGNYIDFWGLHLWGDIEETIEWTAPKPFLGEDGYGRFAWVKLASDASDIGFILHRGDVKDGTDSDRFFDPSINPEIWLRQDDATIYSSQADARGYVTVRYHRDDGDYGTPSPDYNTFWGLHLWGDAINSSEGTVWTEPKPPTGLDSYGAYWNILIDDSNQPVNYIIHRGDNMDPGPDQNFIPFDNATVWNQSGDETIYPSRGAAENTVNLHYHRADGDYGDTTSTDFNDFWGLHVWTGALNPNPSWIQPLKPDTADIYGPVFKVPLIADATELAYILHRGDNKDPGVDQFLVLDTWGYEVWQLEGEGPNPDEPHYVLPILADGDTPINDPPICDANGPYEIECQGLTTTLTLDGTGSSDTDAGDFLNYAWSSPCPGGSFDDSYIAMPLLTLNSSSGSAVLCNAALTVTDSAGASDTCSSLVSVVDTLPPLITCPLDTTIECDQSPDPAITGMPLVEDVCDPSASITFADTVAPGTCSEKSTITRTWTATDASGINGSCAQTIGVADTAAPDIQCNAPATIQPLDAPVSFTAAAKDDCADDLSVNIIGYECFKFTKKGKRIDKTDECAVAINNDTITIEDSAGVGNNITWIIRANDNCGNVAESTCSLIVVKPSKPGL